jgi:hypothetical protein
MYGFAARYQTGEAVVKRRYLKTEEFFCIIDHEQGNIDQLLIPFQITHGKTNAEFGIECFIIHIFSIDFV